MSEYIRKQIALPKYFDVDKFRWQMVQGIIGYMTTTIAGDIVETGIKFSLLGSDRVIIYMNEIPRTVKDSNMTQTRLAEIVTNEDVEISVICRKNI